MTYTELLRAAQLATTREEARKILDYAYTIGVVENLSQVKALRHSLR